MQRVNKRFLICLVTSHLRTFCHISGVGCEQLHKRVIPPPPELFTLFYLTVRICAEERSLVALVAPTGPPLTPPLGFNLVHFGEVSTLSAAASCVSASVKDSCCPGRALIGLTQSNS